MTSNDLLAGISATAHKNAIAAAGAADDEGRIMRDETDARLWAEHHEAFTSSIVEAIRATAAAFKRFHNRRYFAPWRRAPCRDC